MTELVLTLPKGNYRAQIDQCLFEAGVTDNGKALFYCEGGDSGVIAYLQSCGQVCVDGGNGNNDACIN